MHTHHTHTEVSEVYSPREIMTNTRLDYSKHCKIPFGSYCHVFQDNQPSNTDRERTVDAICLGPAGNMQGGYKFFSLSTRKKIIRNQYTILSMPRAIIEQVEPIAEWENRVFDDEDWTVVPGGVDNRTNWIPEIEQPKVEYQEQEEEAPMAEEPNQQVEIPYVDVGSYASVSNMSMSDLDSG